MLTVEVSDFHETKQPLSLVQLTPTVVTAMLDYGVVSRHNKNVQKQGY